MYEDEPAQHLTGVRITALVIIGSFAVVALAGVGSAIWGRGSEPAFETVAEPARTAAFHVTTGIAGIVNVAEIKVLQDVQLVRAEFKDADAGLRVVGARVQFLQTDASKTAGHDTSGWDAEVCGRWAPKKYGPDVSYPVEDLDLHRGEIFRLTFAALAARPGHYVGKGLRLTYVVAGKTKTFEGGSLAIDLTTARKITALPGKKMDCDPKDTAGLYQI